MNKLIRKLAEQAGMEFDDDECLEFGKQIYYVTTEDVEKFAKLTVKETIREMITQMWHHGIDQSNNPSFYKAVEKTEKYFGVAE